MRRGVELLREQSVLSFDGFFKIALADAEAHAGDVERALAILDEALATSERTGHRALDAELLRVRGEMLLKRHPADLAAAEEAFQTAIAVARQQATRSFGLRAALGLAKLCQSTARPAEAHAVLAPALEDFLPTPEMPEIAEAEALLAALAETKEVKAAEAQRQRRLHLQTAYGQAMMWSKGFAAEETRAAFARVDELAVNTGSNAERNAIYFARWVSSLVSGDLNSARRTAKSFLRKSEAEGATLKAAVARRALGWTCLQPEPRRCNSWRNGRPSPRRRVPEAAPDRSSPAAPLPVERAALRKTARSRAGRSAPKPVVARRRSTPIAATLPPAPHPPSACPRR